MHDKWPMTLGRIQNYMLYPYVTVCTPLVNGCIHPRTIPYICLEITIWYGYGHTQYDTRACMAIYCTVYSTVLTPQIDVSHRQTCPNLFRLTAWCILVSPVRRYPVICLIDLIGPISLQKQIFESIDRCRQDVGNIRLESIGYGLDMVIEGLIEAYDSVVEGNAWIVVLSNFWNYFIYFQ